MINKINLSLEHRIFIDRLVEKAIIFASNKNNQGIAYACFIAYQWETIGSKGYNNKVIVKHLYNECCYESLSMKKLLSILQKCSNDIKNCYEDNI